MMKDTLLIAAVILLGVGIMSVWLWTIILLMNSQT